MDVTLQRLDLLEIADRAAGFRDSMLRLRTDENRLIVSATGRTAAEDPISKVVPDSLLPAVVTTAGAANADPAELGKHVRALATPRTRFVGISVWPGFELSGIDPAAPDRPVVPEVAVLAPPPARDMSPQVAALIASGTIMIRRAWTVPFFGILTLGIYLLVWYHRINRELRDLGVLYGEPGRALDVKPGRSTLAVSLGALLIVPPFVSVQRTLRRIQKAEQITEAPEPHLSASRTWVLFILVLPFWTAYVQDHLNRVWQEQLRRSIPAESATPLEPAPEAVPIEIPVPTPRIEPWPVSSQEPIVPALAPPPPPPVPVLAPPPPPPPPPPREPAPAPPPVLAPPPPSITAIIPPPPPRPAPTPPRAVQPPPPPKPDLHDPAIVIIRARYARGEITRQEYRDLLEDLG